MNFSKNESYKTVKSFGLVKGNREIDESHVKELKNLIFANGVWTMMQAVTVNLRTNNVLDGQHRRALWMSLVEEGYLPEDSKLYVSYVEVEPSKEVEYIHNLQQAKNWTIGTFVDSQVAIGNENYRQLKEWCLAHTLTHTNKGKLHCNYRAAVTMMTGKRQEVEIKNGEFKFSMKDAAQAEKVHSELVEILKILGMSQGQANLEALAVAWVKNRPAYSFKEWKWGFTKKKKSQLDTMNTPSERSWTNFIYTVMGTIRAKEMQAEA